MQCIDKLHCIWASYSCTHIRLRQCHKFASRFTYTWSLCYAEISSPYFLWNSDYNSGVRKFRTPDSNSQLQPWKTWTWTPTPTPGPKSDSTPTPGLTVWHNDCVLKDDLREILNSSNKRCTTVYKQTSGMMTGHCWCSMTNKNCTLEPCSTGLNAQSRSITCPDSGSKNTDTKHPGSDWLDTEGWR